MFYGRVMIALIYVDDAILFGSDQDNIDVSIKQLQYYGLSLTVKEDLYDLLGVEDKTDNQSGRGHSDPRRVDQ